MGRDISKGRYLLRWHTHRLVTKTQNYSPYLLIGVFSFLFFSISVDLSVKQTRETVSFFFCGCRSPIHLWNKHNILKKTAPSCTVILAEK